MPAVIEDLLTVEQVARMLQVSPRTIRNRINAGLLPARKLVSGKDWRIRPTDAAALLQEAAPRDDTLQSPLIDRLGTAEGRAHAQVVLAQLGEDRDEAGQRESWAHLQKALEDDPVQLRWDRETWERLGDE